MTLGAALGKRLSWSQRSSDTGRLQVVIALFHPDKDVDSLLDELGNLTSSDEYAGQADKDERKLEGDLRGHKYRHIEQCLIPLVACATPLNNIVK